MKRKYIRWVLLSVILCVLVTLPVVQADDGNYYNFDWEDFWKIYTKSGFSNPGDSRLPCNGSSESSCTWAWEPWYEHGTDIPRFAAETWDGRTVDGYGLMMAWHGGGKNLHGGVFRQENVSPCRTYKFEMWARSGLDTSHLASTNARMRVGISPTGDYPDQIVMLASEIAAITWSPESNSQYAYEKLSVEAEAEGSSITVFTHADTDPNNQPYTFWDEGSFAEVQRTSNLIDASQPLPEASGYIYNVAVSNISSSSAWVSWNTGSIPTQGQVLYRQVGSTVGGITASVTSTHQIFLPVIAQAPAAWQYSTLNSMWQTSHQIQLTGLQSQSIYEYVVVSYGYINGDCTTIVSDTSDPDQFETP